MARRPEIAALEAALRKRLIDAARQLQADNLGDCEAGLARLVHPEEFGISSGAFAASETCALGTRLHLSSRDRLVLKSSATYAQDGAVVTQSETIIRDLPR